ncbi:hypothetical protein WA026_022963 [Henosepilachna vigintioctopunctata]|uniref:Uncharacterized protein n=1 Tax=Henosepilachna vigintioctopunctata TaxID=420089 RepID=A0AAW1TT88_9CUCU
MDVFSPQLSDRVIKSINAVAGLETSEKYAFPNVARELGTLLKKCASIYNYILIENQEREKKKDLKDFCVLLEQNLSDSINKTVMENVAELRRQKVVTLPQESDITLLKNFVTNRAAVFFDRFQSDKTLSNYTNLASFVLVALIIFNRRRPGETERLLLKDFYSGSVAEYEGQAYFRINIRGKLGRTVKLYLDKFQKKCVETILQFRGDVGVEVSNPYEGVISTCDFQKIDFFFAFFECTYIQKYSLKISNRFDN